MTTMRTQYSQHTQPTRNDKNEKEINTKYGADGEEHFMKYLTKNHPSYFWYSFPNKWEAVDFYGIPREGNNNTYDHKKGKGKVEIVIELKSKRLLCDKVSMRARCAVKSSNAEYVAPYDTFLHNMNWSKLEYIKNRFETKTIKKAFMVYDYMKVECEHRLTEYDPKNAGHYIFHEITPHKVARDELLEEWQDYDWGRTYNPSWGGNSNRPVKDKMVNVPAYNMLPMSKFKHFLLPNIESEHEPFLKKQRSLIPSHEKRLRDLLFEYRLRKDNVWLHRDYIDKLKWTKYKHLPHLTFEEFIDIKRVEALEDLRERMTP
jgi:hypothetical protein